MLKNGTIYLLDEPTTGLDGLVAQQLQRTLDALACQATTIMVTHNLDDLRQAQQILYMKDGRIAESGTYQSLCEAGGEFFKQTQARVETSSATTTSTTAGGGGGGTEEKKDA
jgi:ABC-type transport system involved in cytochrome bd biosynthesis fused ATPase/permease subunit